MGHLNMKLSKSSSKRGEIPVDKKLLISIDGCASRFWRNLLPLLGSCDCCSAGKGHAIKCKKACMVWRDKGALDISVASCDVYSGLVD